MSKNRKGHGHLHIMNTQKEQEERNGVIRNRKASQNPATGAEYSKGRNRTATAFETALLWQPKQQQEDERTQSLFY